MDKTTLVLDAADFEFVTNLAARTDHGNLAGELAFVAITARPGTTTEQVERYLPMALLTQVQDFPGWVALVRREWATWLTDRLGSGMLGGSIHDTYTDAQIAVADRVLV